MFDLQKLFAYTLIVLTKGEQNVDFNYLWF